MTPDTPIRQPEEIRQSCANKLHLQISDHFQAILGYLLGEDWSKPKLVELVIMPTGHVLGLYDGESTPKALLGTFEELIKIIHGVAKIAELDGDELGYLLGKVAEIKRQR
jgi:hypothetical protein